MKHLVYLALILPITLFAQPWPEATLSSVDLDTEVIASIDQDIREGKYGLMDYFLIVKDGKLVVDKHYKQNYDSVAAQYDPSPHQYNYDHPDWHPYYKGTDLHTMQSVTKSVTSILLGIAIDKGLIKGVDWQPMTAFNGYKQDLDPRRLKITLQDLLTMRSGISWNEMTSYSNSDNSCIIMESKDDWLTYILDQPMREDPGTVFDYNSGVSVLLGEIVRLRTGKRIDVWAEDVLFGPLDIEYHWKETPAGQIDTEGGLYLSSHDLAKIGYLMLNDGIWNGKQVVSKAWVRESTSPVIKEIFPSNNRQDPGYGYQWWVYDQENGASTLFAGNGYGGQFVFVSRPHNMVVVFNGWNIHGRPPLQSFSATKDRIIPAIK